MEIGITQSIQIKKEDDLKCHCIVYFVTVTKEFIQMRILPINHMIYFCKRSANFINSQLN